MPEDHACVFVVDDDRSIRESLHDLLGSMGLNVQTFASAHEFLTSQRPDGPSCLVLDVQLPGLSGLELQQELAKGQVPMPIIFLTGHGDIPMTVCAMKAGAIDFLTKPFHDQALLNAVMQALHRGRPMAPGTHTPAAATTGARRGTPRTASTGSSGTARRSRRCSRSSTSWPPPRPRCSSRVRPARARNCWRGRCTPAARGAPTRS